jgi:hypothetical protein
LVSLHDVDPKVGLQIGQPWLKDINQHVVGDREAREDWEARECLTMKRADWDYMEELRLKHMGSIERENR